MRVLAPTMLALVLGSAAIAQPGQPVTIEDDVSPANALKCAALRLAQLQRKPDALVEARRDAWLRTGIDAAKANIEAEKFSTRETADLAVIAEECEPFEITSAPPARG